MFISTDESIVNLPVSMRRLLFEGCEEPNVTVNPAKIRTMSYKELREYLYSVVERALGPGHCPKDWDRCVHGIWSSPRRGDLTYCRKRFGDVNEKIETAELKAILDVLRKDGVNAEE